MVITFSYTLAGLQREGVLTDLERGDSCLGFPVIRWVMNRFYYQEATSNNVQTLSSYLLLNISLCSQHHAKRQYTSEQKHPRRQTEAIGITGYKDDYHMSFVTYPHNYHSFFLHTCDASEAISKCWSKIRPRRLASNGFSGNWGKWLYDILFRSPSRTPGLKLATCLSLSVFCE